MQLSKLIAVPFLLAAFSTAAPQPQVQPAEHERQLQPAGEKRQISDVMTGIMALIALVDKWLDNTSKKQAKSATDNGYWYAERQIEGKLSKIGCVYGKEKKIEGKFLKDFLVSYCGDLVADREFPLITNNFPNALFSQRWTIRIPADQAVEWKDDWMEIIIAVQQRPGFNGRSVPMSKDLCRAMVVQSVDVCTWSDNSFSISKGFATEYNGEWSMWVDIKEVKDKQAAKVFGDSYVNPPSLPPTQGPNPEDSALGTAEEPLPED